MSRKVNIHDETLPWQSSAFHVQARYRELAASQGVELDYVEVEAGGRILPHAPGEGVWYFCIEGRGRFLLDRTEFPCEPGDCLPAPRRSVRGIVNEGPGPLRLLVVRPRPERWRLLAWLGRLARR